MGKNVRAKRKLAVRASKLLKDGMTVILDSSTTAYFLVDFIAEKKNMTLITNGIYTAQRAMAKGICVYLTGGKSEFGRPVLTGSYAEETLEKMNADIVFFLSMAMTDDGMVCDCTESENKIRKIMLTRAKTKVLLMDKSKLGKSAQHVLCKKQDVDVIIIE
jgi:DeoR family fructose operon transcriptional repressor